MSKQEIFATLPQYAEELKSIFNKYKQCSDQHLSTLNLATWNDCSSIINENQQYQMSIHLDEHLVPENEKGQVCSKHFTILTTYRVQSIILSIL